MVIVNGVAIVLDNVISNAIVRVVGVILLRGIVIAIGFVNVTGLRIVMVMGRRLVRDIGVGFARSIRRVFVVVQFLVLPHKVP